VVGALGLKKCLEFSDDLTPGGNSKALGGGLEQTAARAGKHFIGRTRTVSE